jgi:hypothetical protein
MVCPGLMDEGTLGPRLRVSQRRGRNRAERRVLSFRPGLRSPSATKLVALSSSGRLAATMAARRRAPR